VYIYINNKLLQEWLGANPTTWYEKNILFEDSMFDVDENANESNLMGEDPIMLDEPYEDEVEHDPFELSHDDKISFSRLLSNLMVRQVQRFEMVMQIQTCHY